MKDLEDKLKEVFSITKDFQELFHKGTRIIALADKLLTDVGIQSGDVLTLVSFFKYFSVMVPSFPLVFF